jgi:hypothetical protein
MNEQIIVIPGNPDERGLVAIWSDTRPHPSHCWLRAAQQHLPLQERELFPATRVRSDLLAHGRGD